MTRKQTKLTIPQTEMLRRAAEYYLSALRRQTDETGQFMLKDEVDINNLRGALEVISPGVE